MKTMCYNLAMPYIYVIGPHQGPYKVGVSSSPDRRRSALQTGAAHRLSVHHVREVPEDSAFALEEAAHRFLSKWAMHGEWFDAPVDHVIWAVQNAAVHPTRVPGYAGIIHKEPGSDYGISFPDLPGCVSAASTIAGVVAAGREAIIAHLDAMAAERLPAPAPSPMEAVAGHPWAKGGALVFIDLPSNKAVRISVTIAEDALREIDHYAEEHGLTRSGFLARAARREMETA